MTDTCVQPIKGLQPARNVQGDVYAEYVDVPCNLPTTHRCTKCDLPICRWHMVAHHEHRDE